MNNTYDEISSEGVENDIFFGSRRGSDLCACGALRGLDDYQVGSDSGCDDLASRSR